MTVVLALFFSINSFIYKVITHRKQEKSSYRSTKSKAYSIQDKVVTIFAPLTKLWNILEDERNSIPDKFSECGALRDLILFVQLEKREKHPWRSDTFSKVAGCLQLY